MNQHQGDSMDCLAAGNLKKQETQKRFNGFLPAQTLASDGMGGVFFQNGGVYYVRRANLTRQPGPLPIDPSGNLRSHLSGGYLSNEEKMELVRKHYED